jgi:hypothetical protein
MNHLFQLPTYFFEIGRPLRHFGGPCTIVEPNNLETILGRLRQIDIAYHLRMRGIGLPGVEPRGENVGQITAHLPRIGMKIEKGSG